MPAPRHENDVDQSIALRDTLSLSLLSLFLYLTQPNHTPLPLIQENHKKKKKLESRQRSQRHRFDDHDDQSVVKRVRPTGDKALLHAVPGVNLSFGKGWRGRRGGAKEMAEV